MRLERNVSGRNKYAVINMRDNTISWGEVGSPDEFFVIKLKDRYAKRALLEYANAAAEDGDHEFAADIREMAGRCGSDKRPD